MQKLFCIYVHKINVFLSETVLNHCTVFGSLKETGVCCQQDLFSNMKLKVD